MPNLKKKIFEKVNSQYEQFQIEKGEEGTRAGNLARRRIRLKKLADEQQEKDELENLILETSKTSALNAINLSQLLNKKWSEQKNAYMVMSKIKTEKQERRIMALLNSSK